MGWGRGLAGWSESWSPLIKWCLRRFKKVFAWCQGAGGILTHFLCGPRAHLQSPWVLRWGLRLSIRPSLGKDNNYNVIVFPQLCVGLS
jgi:hypothetical protein